MGKFVLGDCFIEVAGVDFTDHVSSVAVNMPNEELDVTTFSDEGRRRARGMADHSFDLNFQHDYDPGSVEATLAPLHASGEDFLVRVRARSSVTSPTNPQWSAECVLLNYQPLAGEAGNLSQTQVSLPAQGGPIVKTVA